MGVVHGGLRDERMQGGARAVQEGARGVSDAVPRRFIAGDALRGIACLAVVVFHAAIEALIAKGLVDPVQITATAERSTEPLRPLFGALTGEIGLTRASVYVFFVLSGYLLSRTFIAAYTMGTPLPSISRYFRNRALRILPAFWLVTTIFVLWTHTRVTSGLLSVYAFAQNYHWTRAGDVIPQAWTLDVEVAFYILIPIAALAMVIASRRLRTTAHQRLGIVLLALLLAYVFSLVLKHLAGNPLHATYNLANYFFAFIPGVALAAVEPFAAPRLRGSRSGRLWAWVALALSVALLGALVSLHSRDVGLRLVLATLGCGALVAAPLILQWATGGSWRVLDNRVVNWLGERSYGIYLIHLGLMPHVLSHIGSHGLKATFLLLLIGALVPTLVVADLLWRIVERPAMQRRLPWRQAEFARGAPLPAATAD
jgi:peptidoglycan/LPS O-acetylase OafA/YrhL